MKKYISISFVIEATPVWLVYLLGFCPAIFLFFKAYNNLVGPDPLKVIEHELGKYALIFLIVVLLFKPLGTIFKIRLLKFRRCIGLLSFWHAFLHVLTYVVLDMQLILDLIVKDITKRPYIIIGALSFLILVLLAVTSNKISVKILGGRYWRSLHLFVYLAAFFGAAHYLLLVKSWPLEPIIYMLIVISLILFRWIPWKTLKVFRKAADDKSS